MKYIIAQTVENKAIATDYTGTLKDGSVALTAVNGGVMAKGTIDKLVEVREKLVKGEIKVFDTATFKDKDGNDVTTYMADVNTDDAFTPDTPVIKTEGTVSYFAESAFRSAPYFDLEIQGITRLNVAFGD